MYPPQFDYHRASSLEDAFSLLERHAEREPRVLAGGHSLIPAMKTGGERPEVVVDIGSIGTLEGVDVDSDSITIGALTTYAGLLERADAEPAISGALTDATASIGDLQVRNRGTVGGNLAQAEPAADLPAAALALDAVLVVASPNGDREIPADDFFEAERTTALEDHELLTRVRLPRVDGRASAYVRKTHPASGWASIGVAAALGIEDRQIASARVAATGVTNCAVRLPGVEKALEGEQVEAIRSETDDSEALEDAADRAGETLEPDELRSDLSASGEYRAHLLPTYAARALEAAADRVGGRSNGGDDS